MANRTVAVALKAEIGSYVAGMTKAAIATKDVGDSAEATGKKAKTHFDLAGKASLLMGGAVAGALYGMVSKSVEFEKSMSAISAATGATGSALEQFRGAAMKAGADSQYSATEAANAITEMAKAGVSAKDILGGGLNGALDLAAAGQLDVAEAAGIASVAMTQFSLSGKDIPHVADLLAAGAGKAMGSVDDLGMALNQAGLVASASGLSIEETTGTLAAFASAGLLGSDAGTSMKTMLQKLQAPSKEAAQVMSDLGINMYDANGNMLGMAEMAGQLEDHMSGLTQEQRNSALATIFGSDAVRAANVLYKEGAAGIEDWTGKVNDAGYAQEQAAALTDNLAGDIERLGGALDTAFIKSGGAFTGILRDLAQALTGVVNGASALMNVIGAIPGPVLAAVAAVGAFALLRGPVSGAFTRMTEAALQWYIGLGRATGAAGGFRGAMSGIASSINPAMVAVAAATILIGSITSKMAESAAQEHKWAQAILDGGSAAQTAAAMYKKSRDDAFGFDWMKDLDEWSGAAASMDDAKQAAKELYDAMTPLEQGQADVTIATNNLAFAIDKFGKDSPEARKAAEKLALANQSLATKQDDVTAAADKAAVALAATPAVMDNAYGSLANYAAALGLDKDATKALTDQSALLGQSLANFIDPLGTYTGLLQQKAQAEADAANKTAEKTGAASKSWEDFKDSVHVTFDEYMADLEAQVTAQANWQTNMLLLAGRVSEGTLQELSKMGPEGAPLVADLVNRSDAELDKFDDVTAKRSKEATDAWGAQLTLAAPVLAAVGKTAGQGVVASLVAQLQAGTITVAEIAAQYGINLAGGINPVLVALGKPRVSPPRNGQRMADLWSGGYTGDGGKYEPKGVVHGGEYVLTKEQTSRLGIDRIEEFANIGYANGGFVSAADVPRPYSTAPTRPPISTAGDATMQKGFDEVVAWLKANAASGSIGNGPAGGTWQQLWAKVHAQFPTARKTSDYRPGDPGYHGRGKAVDVAGARPGDAGVMLAINRWAAASFGGSLAELIHTPGINLWHGKPHTYNAATRADHYDHVHMATYDQGGPLYPGYTLAYNGTGRTEWVSKEQGGSGGGGGVVIDYDRLAAAVTANGRGVSIGKIVTERNETGRELAERIAFLARG